MTDSREDKRAPFHINEPSSKTKVFHLIFQIYGTPDHLKHKPLFWGICGAVFFRLLFIFIGEYLMHAMWAAHLFFGAFLVYFFWPTSSSARS